MMQEYVLPADAARKIGKKIREDGDREVCIIGLNCRNAHYAAHFVKP